jgi:hypothetical protein
MRYDWPGAFPVVAAAGENPVERDAFLTCAILVALASLLPPRRDTEEPYVRSAFELRECAGDVAHAPMLYDQPIAQLEDVAG